MPTGKSVSLLGDLPIYAAPDSSEVWHRPDLFQVASDSGFSHVAGVPPDYFNENGQYWGNPLYDGSVMKLKVIHGGWIDWRFS